MEVIATSGDPRPGGDDWDLAIARWLEDRFVAEHGVPIDAFGRLRLRDAAEEAKVRLSEATSTRIEVASLANGLGLNVTLTRRKMEAMCRHLVLRLVQPMLEVAALGGHRVQGHQDGHFDQGRALHDRVDKNTGVHAQERTLDELNKRVAEVYRAILAEADNSLGTLQMLTNIEAKLEELLSTIDMVPTGGRRY